MDIILVFWGSLAALLVLLTVIMPCLVTVSLLFSSVSGIISAFGRISFLGELLIFILSFVVLLLVGYATSRFIDRMDYNGRLRAELSRGAVYGYVCETVYPDIPGAVMINGKRLPARSNRIFRHGDVVLCRDEGDMMYIPLLSKKRKNTRT